MKLDEAPLLTDFRRSTTNGRIRPPIMASDITSKQNIKALPDIIDGYLSMMFVFVVAVSPPVPVFAFMSEMLDNRAGTRILNRIAARI